MIIMLSSAELSPNWCQQGQKVITVLWHPAPLQVIKQNYKGKTSGGYDGLFRLRVEMTFILEMFL